jgi:protein-disulfide isomerase
MRFFRKFVRITALAVLPLFGITGCSERGKPEPAAPAASSVDLEQTMEIARKEIDKIRFNMSASRDTKIEVVNAKPSPVPGLVELRLKVSLEDRTAVRKVTVTPDLKYVIIGQVVKLGQIPRMRVDTENVDFENSPVRGTGKQVTIVEYSDFQCPYCRASQENIERALREYDGKVRLVYKHFPLKMHPWAGDASLLSECARLQKPELFWKLHDYYYKNTQRLTRENILKMTQEQVKGDGIDMDKFNKCYLEQEVAPKIKKDLDEGRSIGVRGTPAFIVNDVFLSGAVPYPVLNAIILEELGHDWTKDPTPPAAPKSGDEKAAAPATKGG